MHNLGASKSGFQDNILKNNKKKKTEPPTD